MEGATEFDEEQAAGDSDSSVENACVLCLCDGDEVYTPPPRAAHAILTHYTRR